MIIKISKKNVKPSLEDEIKILDKIRKSLINNDVAKEICDDNNFDYWILKSVSIRFDNIDTTAKTINGNIILSKKLLKKSHETIMKYVIHELVHVFQHIDEYGKKKKINRKKDYLNREHEIEAFQYQLQFDKKQKGEKKVEDYVENLLDYHKIPDSKREDKKKELMEKVDDK
jgi:hypothetical protein